MKLTIVSVFTFLLIQVTVSLIGTKDKNKKPTYAPPKIIKNFTFGFGDSFADSLWIRLIQSFEYCGVENTETESIIPSVTEQTTLEDKVVRQKMNFFDALDEEKNQKSKCHQGWAYQMLDRVTDLSPRFLLAYTAGATVLSVITDDRSGAAKIYEKGLKEYPNDWSLSYRAAYHYLYEMRDYARAAELMHVAAANGAPLWVRSLASKLYQRAGQLLLGKTVALELLAVSKGKPDLERKARLQLKKIDELLVREEEREGKKEHGKSLTK